jgi:hypothetical protein
VLRFRDGPEHIGGVELPQNASHMKIDGVVGHINGAGDFSAGQSGGAPAQDFTLAG